MVRRLAVLASSLVFAACGAGSPSPDEARFERLSECVADLQGVTVHYNEMLAETTVAARSDLTPEQLDARAGLFRRRIREMGAFAAQLERRALELGGRLNKTRGDYELIRNRRTERINSNQVSRIGTHVDYCVRLTGADPLADHRMPDTSGR
ncbi:MAG TPA: hypothetical protein VEC11_03335 [Allosphingosinicella sp.]|nr:hypothetical protein [Allosphingosinicella sp.]